MRRALNWLQSNDRGEVAAGAALFAAVMAFAAAVAFNTVTAPSDAQHSRFLAVAVGAV